MPRASVAHISMTPSHSTAEPMPRRVGVVGPGLMGLGIAQAFAAAGVEVALCGRDVEAARAGRERLADSLRRKVSRGRLDAASEAAILSRVSLSSVTPDGLARCAIVIESVPEDRALKADVLSRIEAAAPSAIVATNTSGLAIAGLAAALRAPQRFLGLHFFSPAERMPLVEVVKGPETSETTAAVALVFLKALGKRPIAVRDGPGFFATRVFAAYLDEAAAMVAEGVAPALIEEAALANGRALGPLAMLDETGLALNLQQGRQARADGLEPRFRRPLAEPVLARLVELGRAGRRAGGGFFDWPEEGARTLWDGLATLFPLDLRQPDFDTVKLRLLTAETREALRLLEEGGIASADDADAASVLGLGFPVRTGGVLRWAESFGLARFVAACDRFASVRGDRFAPSAWLRELAMRGEGLKAYRRQESVA
jgi:3-hydroxyacyl-CoA dehydrogenase